MLKKYPDHKQFRLPNYDYSTPSLYFITICTKNKLHYFGEIVDNNLKPTEIGVLVQNKWQEIPKHFPNIKLHSFCLMPNHLHGVLEIIRSGHSVGTHDHAVGTRRGTFLQYIAIKSGQTISSSINHFKGSVTKRCNQQNLPFAWQPRFHDHVIRTEKEYIAISKYIFDNPINWAKDDLNLNPCYNT